MYGPTVGSDRAWETRTEFVLETAQGLLLSDLGLLLLYNRVRCPDNVHGFGF